MKKILLTLSLCLVALAGMAQKQYTEKIAVQLNGYPFPETSSVITVTENADGTCHFVLPNFILPAPTPEESPMYVGTIDVEGVKMTSADGYSGIAYKGDISILPGDIDIPEEDMWIGPFLGPVPLDLNGKLTGENLYCTIHIEMGEEMIIDVTVGSDTSAGIGQVVVARQHGGVYTLGGVRVADVWSAALPKGVYIVNGKKVIK